MTTLDKSLSQQIIALLQHCQHQQSEQDGIRWPEPGKGGVATDETLDDFAQQLQTACVSASRNDRLLARLAVPSRPLEYRGQVDVPAGHDYAEAALGWLSAQAGTRTLQDDQN